MRYQGLTIQGAWLVSCGLDSEDTRTRFSIFLDPSNDLGDCILTGTIATRVANDRMTCKSKFTRGSIVSIYVVNVPRQEMTIVFVERHNDGLGGRRNGFIERYCESSGTSLRMPSPCSLQCALPDENGLSYKARTMYFW